MSASLITQYPYLGSGKVFARKRGAAEAMLHVGNVSKLTFAVKEDVKKQVDYTKGGGGTYAEVRRITECTAALTMHDLSPINLARAAYGTAGVVEGDTITGEAATAYHGGLVRLAHINPTAVTVKVGATTKAEGTDYVVTPAGLLIPTTSSIADAAAITVDYTYADYETMDALTVSGVDLEVTFEGLNEATSGTPVVIDVWKLRLGALKNLDLIGDNFAALEQEGEVQRDASKPAGISGYFRARMARPA